MIDNLIPRQFIDFVCHDNRIPWLCLLKDSKHSEGFSHCQPLLNPADLDGYLAEASGLHLGAFLALHAMTGHRRRNFDCMYPRVFCVDGDHSPLPSAWPLPRPKLYQKRKPF